VIHALYVAAVAAALHPVFLAASAVMVAAFGLSWLLRDVPLRETAGAAAIGESVAATRVASSGIQRSRSHALRDRSAGADSKRFIRTAEFGAPLHCGRGATVVYEHELP
jgi:hypothetical protein